MPPLTSADLVRAIEKTHHHSETIYIPIDCNVDAELAAKLEPYSGLAITHFHQEELDAKDARETGR